MSPASANPLIHEASLMEEFGITPDLLEDQVLELPSFTKFLKWIFGKPLGITLKKGIEAKKIDLLLTIIDQKNLAEQDAFKKMTTGGGKPF